MNRHVESYKEISLKMKPLDLLLFRGSESVSKLIMKLEEENTGYGEFSHVGIVVSSELFHNIHGIESGKWYIWESTISGPMGEGVKNIKGKSFLGVQVRNFEEVVIKTGEKGGNVAWAPLINNPWVSEEEKEKIISQMMLLYHEYNGRPYDCCISNLLGSIFPCCKKFRATYRKISKIIPKVGCFSRKNKKNPLDWQFCSELVARIYKSMNIISNDIDPEDVTPVYFLNNNIVDDPTFFLEASSGIIFETIV